MVLRMSTMLLKTLREEPADAEVPSHKLLVRAGYVRRVAAGLWTWLPLGKIVLDRVAAIVREEMAAIGGQEVHFPAIIPREIFETSGRWNDYGDLLFRLHDRRDAAYLLRPDARLAVLVLRPQVDEAAKARALVLPLSA